MPQKPYELVLTFNSASSVNPDSLRRLSIVRTPWVAITRQSLAMLCDHELTLQDLSQVKSATFGEISPRSLHGWCGVWWHKHNDDNFTYREASHPCQIACLWWWPHRWKACWDTDGIKISQVKVSRESKVAFAHGVWEGLSDSTQIWRVTSTFSLCIQTCTSLDRILQGSSGTECTDWTPELIEKHTCSADECKFWLQSQFQGYTSQELIRFGW
jgi:hypothetical protein